MSNLETAQQLAEALESRDLAEIRALLPDGFVANGPTLS